MTMNCILGSAAGWRDTDKSISYFPDRIRDSLVVVPESGLFRPSGWAGESGPTVWSFLFSRWPDRVRPD
jgi:hypothetical protein